MGVHIRLQLLALLHWGFQFILNVGGTQVYSNHSTVKQMKLCGSAAVKIHEFTQSLERPLDQPSTSLEGHGLSLVFQFHILPHSTAAQHEAQAFTSLPLLHPGHACCPLPRHLSESHYLSCMPQLEVQLPHHFIPLRLLSECLSPSHGGFVHF